MATGLKNGRRGKVPVASGTPPQILPSLKVLPRVDAKHGPRFRVVASLGGGDGVEVTGALTSALAHALWQLRSGADISNWVDAERLLDFLVEPRAETEVPARPAPVDVVIPRKRAGSTK